MLQSSLLIALLLQFIHISNALDIKMPSKPKLIAFDLDGTIWTPDMYQLWGGGSPFTFAQNGKDLVDSRGISVRLLGISAEVLHNLRNNEEYKDTKVAWVSCTDEPEWADECMTKFKTVPGGKTLKSCIDSSHIYKSNKQTHFENIKKEFKDTIDFHEMLFFDNEMGNINSVSKLGVKSLFCPDGITVEAWEKGLQMFE